MWDRCELVHAPPLSATLGESRFKLKIHLQGFKVQTYHDVFSGTSDALSVPLSISASSNLHKIVRMSLQTQILSRTVADVRVPLRSLELLAREGRAHTFTLAGRSGATRVLAHCHLAIRFNLSPEEERVKEQLQDELGMELEPAAVGPVAWLCGSLRRCFGGAAELRRRVEEEEQQGLRGRKASKKTVTIHPDF